MGQEHLSRAKVEDFYREHESKFFYNRLVTYMSSGPSNVHILGRENEAIKTWRKLMGPWKLGENYLIIHSSSSEQKSIIQAQRDYIIQQTSRDSYLLRPSLCTI